MSKKPTAYKQAINLLLELKKLYPNYSLGMHLSTCLSDYGDAWTVTDRELLFALEKYKTELEMNIVSDREIDKILKEGENLDKLFAEEDDDGY